MHEAMHYEHEDDLIHCQLCPFNCRIADGKTGRCRVRKHQDGKLWSLNYARITSAHMDPIEKKPLYHFHPGSQILSLGTFGCNLSCEFCQNWTISQGSPPTEQMPPQEAVDLAVRARNRGNVGIAYTYNEPIIWYEYVIETARLAHEHDMKNVLVTNGYIQPEPLEQLLPHIDAMNVDIKSTREEFYRRLCGGDGKASRRTVERAFDDIHVEITNLIITDENDDEQDMIDLFDWAASVSPKLPVHLSRYHPAHKMDNPPTSTDTLRRAYELATERLDFVFVGNVHIDGTTDTICPNCGEVVVERGGFSSRSETTDGTCPACGEDIGIVT